VKIKQRETEPKEKERREKIMTQARIERATSPYHFSLA
jgi:hypothetical protein